ncbi:MAG: asparaginase [Oligoflexales bacterium]
MDIRNAKPLFALKRGNAFEILAYGVCAMARDGKLLDPQIGDIKVITRSTLKPWQFLGADVFKDEDIWTLGMASSAGQELHVKRLQEFQALIQGDESKLILPQIYPVDPIQRSRCFAEGRQRSRYYHFCCGKHLMMQYASKVYGYSPENYWEPHHPLQQKIKTFIHAQIGCEVEWVTDGCGLPTVYTPIKNLVTLWHKMGASNDPRFLIMKDLWGRNPVLMGGDDILDTQIMVAAEGRVVAKEGADGVFGMQTRVERGEPSFSLILKLAHGTSKQHVILALWSQLDSQKKHLPPSMLKVLDFLSERRKKLIDSKQSFVAATEIF